MKYNSFKIDKSNKVTTVSFNRPDKANSLDKTAWEEMKNIFETLDKDPETRVIILHGEGKNFCAGIDLALLMDMQKFQTIDCEGRKREQLREFIFTLQNSISAIEKCRKPVLACIHNGCIGGGVDIIAACDMRYCTEDAYFTIKEIDLGLVADIGTLQRLPTILNPGFMAEMAYTGRKVHGAEASQKGLVNEVYKDKDEMMERVIELARLIASKSPLCIRGTKEMLLYKRDHTVEESLNYMVAWNASMLLSNDLMEAFQASMEKRQAIYED